MRLSAARITPLAEESIEPALAERLKTRAAAGGVLNVYRTLARDPKGLAAFLNFGGHILSNHNGLAPRQREIVILRTGFLCRSGYEWTQHVRMGARAGLTEPEFEAIKRGAEDPSWSAADAVLIRMADELHADQFVTDETWAEMSGHFDDQAKMIAVLAAGQYTLVSMLLNTLGVQLDEGQTLDPDLDAR